MTSLKRKLIIAAVGLVVLIFGVYFYFPVNINAEASFVKTEVSPSYPSRIKIPKLGINSKINAVGMTSEGAMDVPAGPEDTGWFKLGPRPGEVGSAVIDGHSGWKDNIPAVFDNLSKLEIGDEIIVEDENGVSISFVVTKIKPYASTADATDIFTSNDRKSHLNLITCAGVWNEVTLSSSKRLVVFTDRIN